MRHLSIAATQVRCWRWKSNKGTPRLRSGASGEGHEYWFAQDGLGSIAAVTKHEGQSAHEYFYTPFGGIVDDNGHPEDNSNWTDPHNHYLLTGKEWDEEMELYYFGARYYDAATGVWLTQDVYRGAVEQPLTLHRTLYALANPVNNVDAYGYRVVANGYGDSGGGSTPVHPRDSAPDPARQDNHPCEWKPKQGGSGGGGRRGRNGSGGGGGRDEPEDKWGGFTYLVHEWVNGPEPSDTLQWGLDRPRNLESTELGDVLRLGFNRLRDWASRKVLETPVVTWSDMPGASGITIGGMIRGASEIKSFIDLARESEGDVGVEEWFWATMRADFEITGTKESVIGFSESGLQLVQDTQVVFSDAPLKERIWPSVRVGLFGEVVALTLTGLGGIRPNLPGGVLEEALASGGHTESLALVKELTTMIGGRPTYDVDVMVKEAQANSILQELKSGTQYSQHIADLIEQGEIGMNIVGEEEFASAFQQEFGEKPFSIDRGLRPSGSNEFYLRASKLSSEDLPVKVVHETTHILDPLDTRTGTIQLDRELSAFIREAEFAQSRGLPSDALDILLKGGYASLEETIINAYGPGIFGPGSP